MTPTDNATLYSLTRASRQRVLDWLETLPHEVFVQEVPDVAYGSLRGIYEHIAECYLFWVDHIGLHHERPNLQVKTVAELRQAFDRVDDGVAAFMATGGDWNAQFEQDLPNGVRGKLSKNWLLWHPITHEFHHKGQALAVARWVGHPHPGQPDTDFPTFE